MGRSRRTDLSYQMPSSQETDTVDDQSSWQKPLTVDYIPVIQETLEKILCSPECKETLHEEAATHSSEDSRTTGPLRQITGGRYEIFLARAGDHSNDLALKLMEQVIGRLPAGKDGFPRLFTDPQEVIDVLIQDATEKARASSPTLATAEFENFSILVNTERCDAQPMHIDGNVAQGVYFITDKSPTTQIWHPKGDSITTPGAALDDIWRKLVPDVEASVWDEIRQSIENQEQTVGLTAKECIRRYGDLLLMSEDLREESELAVPRGTVRMVQPHGLHAGPASDENRSVIYFSERVPAAEQPKLESSTSKLTTLPLESYNTDIQRSGVQLLVEIQSKIWPVLSQEARHVMMQILQIYIQRRPVRPTEVVSGPSVTNVVQWLYDCHQHPNLSQAATEIIDVVVSSGKADFREACAHFMERGRS